MFLEVIIPALTSIIVTILTNLANKRLKKDELLKHQESLENLSIRLEESLLNKSQQEIENIECQRKLNDNMIYDKSLRSLKTIQDICYSYRSNITTTYDLQKICISRIIKDLNNLEETCKEIMAYSFLDNNKNNKLIKTVNEIFLKLKSTDVYLSNSLADIKIERLNKNFREIEELINKVSQ